MKTLWCILGLFMLRPSALPDTVTAVNISVGAASSCELVRDGWLLCCVRVWPQHWWPSAEKPWRVVVYAQPLVARSVARRVLLA